MHRAWLTATAVGLGVSGSAMVSLSARRLAQPLEVSIPIRETGGERHFQIGNQWPSFAQLHVVVRNRSDKPQNIWADWCSRGANNLRLEITNIDGAPCRTPLIVERKDMVWSADWPDAEVLEPGDSRVYDIKLDNGREVRLPGNKRAVQWTQGGRYRGFPMPGKWKSCVVTMRAVLSIGDSQEARKHHVWTGTVASPIQRYVAYQPVDRLNTYLRLAADSNPREPGTSPPSRSADSIAELGQPEIDRLVSNM